MNQLANKGQAIYDSVHEYYSYKLEVVLIELSINNLKTILIWPIAIYVPIATPAWCLALCSVIIYVYRG